MSAPDPRVEAIAKVLRDESGGTTYHSWRCSYPDLYGQCDCDAEVAAHVLAALPEPETLGWTVRVVPYWEQKPYFSGTFRTRDMAEAHARVTLNVECRVVRVVAEP